MHLWPALHADIKHERRLELHHVGGGEHWVMATQCCACGKLMVENFQPERDFFSASCRGKKAGGHLLLRYFSGEIIKAFKHWDLNDPLKESICDVLRLWDEKSPDKLVSVAVSCLKEWVLHFGFWSLMISYQPARVLTGAACVARRRVCVCDYKKKRERDPD